MPYQLSVLGCLIAAIVARPVSGQPRSSAAVSVSGGVTTLTAESGQLRDPGGHIQVGISRPARSFVSSRLRVDAGYHSVPGVDSPGLAMPNSGVWIATGSIVKDMSAIREFRPYLIAGVGATSIDQVGGREVHVNVAGGVGIALPPLGRIRPFVEGRFHRALTGIPNSFIPLSLGIEF